MIAIHYHSHHLLDIVGMATRLLWATVGQLQTGALRAFNHLGPDLVRRVAAGAKVAFTLYGVRTNNPHFSTYWRPKGRGKDDVVTNHPVAFDLAIAFEHVESMTDRTWRCSVTTSAATVARETATGAVGVGDDDSGWSESDV